MAERGAEVREIASDDALPAYVECAERNLIFSAPSAGIVLFEISRTGGELEHFHRGDSVAAVRTENATTSLITPGSGYVISLAVEQGAAVEKGQQLIVLRLVP
jgi:acetyl/propionyl-CoA carboxylase alpha subunit